MAFSILGQVALEANTDTIVFQAGGATVLSTVAVCNRTLGDVYYSLAVTPTNIGESGGTAIPDEAYIVYQAAIPPAGSDYHTIGITLGAGEYVVAWCDAGGISVNVFGDG